MVIGTTLSLGNWSTVALSVVLAFAFGYLLTMLPLLRAGVAPRTALGLAFASDTVSIAIMEIVDNAVVLLIPGAMAAGLGDFLFWGSLALSLVIAGLGCISGGALADRPWPRPRGRACLSCPWPPLAFRASLSRSFARRTALDAQSESWRCGGRHSRRLQHVELPQVLVAHVQHRLDRQQPGAADALLEVAHLGELRLRLLVDRRPRSRSRASSGCPWRAARARCRAAGSRAGRRPPARGSGFFSVVQVAADRRVRKAAPS